MTAEKPRSRFDWAIYADATFAGLSILIPIPLLDVFFEWLFKRRMPGAIAQRHGRRLDRYTLHYLNRNELSCMGCLLMPLQLVFLLLKRAYRTILYFLTIKDATDNLSFYWHRAFLLDHMLRRGDLESEEQAKLAATAMHGVLDELTTSPLTQLAREITARTTHVLRATWHWVRRHEVNEETADTRTQMANAWADFDTYFAEVAARYEQRLEQLQVAAVQAQIGMPAEGQAGRLRSQEGGPPTAADEGESA
jgi:hypothetical protein